MSDYDFDMESTASVNDTAPETQHAAGMNDAVNDWQARLDATSAAASRRLAELIEQRSIAARQRERNPEVPSDHRNVTTFAQLAAAWKADEANFAVPRVPSAPAPLRESPLPAARQLSSPGDGASSSVASYSADDDEDGGSEYEESFHTLSPTPRDNTAREMDPVAESVPPSAREGVTVSDAAAAWRVAAPRPRAELAQSHPADRERIVNLADLLASAGIPTTFASESSPAHHDGPKALGHPLSEAALPTSSEMHTSPSAAEAVSSTAPAFDNYGFNEGSNGMPSPGTQSLPRHDASELQSPVIATEVDANLSRVLLSNAAEEATPPATTSGDAAPAALASSTDGVSQAQSYDDAAKPLGDYRQRVLSSSRFRATHSAATAAVALALRAAASTALNQRLGASVLQTKFTTKMPAAVAAVPAAHSCISVGSEPAASQVDVQSTAVAVSIDHPSVANSVAAASAPRTLIAAANADRDKNVSVDAAGRLPVGTDHDARLTTSAAVIPIATSVGGDKLTAANEKPDISHVPRNNAEAVAVAAVAALRTARSRGRTVKQQQRTGLQRLAPDDRVERVVDRKSRSSLNSVSLPPWQPSSSRRGTTSHAPQQLEHASIAADVTAAAASLVRDADERRSAAEAQVLELRAQVRQLSNKLKVAEAAIACTRVITDNNDNNKDVRARRFGQRTLSPPERLGYAAVTDARTVTPTAALDGIAPEIALATVFRTAPPAQRAAGVRRDPRRVAAYAAPPPNAAYFESLEAAAATTEARASHDGLVPFIPLRIAAALYDELRETRLRLETVAAEAGAAAAAVRTEITPSSEPVTAGGVVAPLPPTTSQFPPADAIGDGRTPPATIEASVMRTAVQGDHDNLPTQVVSSAVAMNSDMQQLAAAQRRIKQLLMQLKAAKNIEPPHPPRNAASRQPATDQVAALATGKLTSPRATSKDTGASATVDELRREVARLRAELGVAVSAKAAADASARRTARELRAEVERVRSYYIGKERTAAASNTAAAASNTAAAAVTAAAALPIDSLHARSTVDAVLQRRTSSVATSVVTSAGRIRGMSRSSSGSRKGALESSRAMGCVAGGAPSKVAQAPWPARSLGVRNAPPTGISTSNTVKRPQRLADTIAEKPAIPHVTVAAVSPATEMVSVGVGTCDLVTADRSVSVSLLPNEEPAREISPIESRATTEGSTPAPPLFLERVGVLSEVLGRLDARALLREQLLREASEALRASQEPIAGCHSDEDDDDDIEALRVAFASELRRKDAVLAAAKGIIAELTDALRVGSLAGHTV